MYVQKKINYVYKNEENHLNELFYITKKKYSTKKKIKFKRTEKENMLDVSIRNTYAIQNPLLPT